MTNYDIKSLIPQREPILLVDALVGVEGDMARTQLTVRRDNSFVGDDGLLAEPAYRAYRPVGFCLCRLQGHGGRRFGTAGRLYRRSEEVSLFSLPPGGRRTTDHGDLRAGSGWRVLIDG